MVHMLDGFQGGMTVFRARKEMRSVDAINVPIIIARLISSRGD
jgi:hypothetical protein